MKNKICCIFNYGPHYRAPIYQLMDRELGCDFYFGDKVETPIKKLNYRILEGFKNELINTNILGSSFVWQKGVIRLLFKPYEYYIITGLPNYLSNWLILLFAKLTKKKVFVWTHGMKNNDNEKGKLFEKSFYKLCDVILLYGNYSKQVMLNEGFSKKKLICIYNSLDYDNQLLIRNKLKTTSIYSSHFKNDLPVVVYIGRIQKVKKLDLLIKAIKHLNKTKDKCNLVFIGKDTDNNNLQELVNELDLSSSVWFYGPCYEESKIGELLYNAKVCVSPGPVGLTALHAMSYGTPVVTNDDFKNQMPEHETIINKITGSFFENDNFEDLCKNIAFWIKYQNRSEIRKNTFSVIDENYNPTNQVNILRRILIEDAI